MLTIFESNFQESSDPVFNILINETNNLINYEDEEIFNPIEINSFDDYFEIFEFVVDNFHDTNSFLFEQVFFEAEDEENQKKRNLSLLGSAREKVKNFFGRIKNKVSNTKLGRRVFDGKFKNAVMSKMSSNHLNGYNDYTPDDIKQMVTKYYRLDPHLDRNKIDKLTAKHTNPDSLSNQYRKIKTDMHRGTLIGLTMAGLAKNPIEFQKLKQPNPRKFAFKALHNVQKNTFNKFAKDIRKMKKA